MSNTGPTLRTLAILSGLVAFPRQLVRDADASKAWAPRTILLGLIRMLRALFVTESSWASIGLEGAVGSPE